MQKKPSSQKLLKSQEKQDHFLEGTKFAQELLMSYFVDKFNLNANTASSFFNHKPIKKSHSRDFRNDFITDQVKKEYYLQKELMDVKPVEKKPL